VLRSKELHRPRDYLGSLPFNDKFRRLSIASLFEDYESFLFLPPNDSALPFELAISFFDIGACSF
jgi:hypothetical protein